MSAATRSGGAATRSGGAATRSGDADAVRAAEQLGVTAKAVVVKAWDQWQLMAAKDKKRYTKSGGLEVVHACWDAFDAWETARCEVDAFLFLKWALDLKFVGVAAQVVAGAAIANFDFEGLFQKAVDVLNAEKECVVGLEDQAAKALCTIWSYLPVILDNMASDVEEHVVWTSSAPRLLEETIHECNMEQIRAAKRLVREPLSCPRVRVV